MPRAKQATVVDVLRCSLVLLELLRGANEVDNAPQKGGDGVWVIRREGEVRVKVEDVRGEGWRVNERPTECVSEASMIVRLGSHGRKLRDTARYR
jgi:hypothetical protein